MSCSSLHFWLRLHFLDTFSKNWNRFHVSTTGLHSINIYNFDNFSKTSIVFLLLTRDLCLIISNNSLIYFSLLITLLLNFLIKTCCSSENCLLLCPFYWKWCIFDKIYNISDQNKPFSGLHFVWVHTYSIALVKLQSFSCFLLGICVR